MQLVVQTLKGGVVPAAGDPAHEKTVACVSADEPRSPHQDLGKSVVVAIHVRRDRHARLGMPFDLDSNPPQLQAEMLDLDKQFSGIDTVFCGLQEWG